MGTTYTLVNQTKHEQITFLHIPAGKARELAGHPPAAAITTWYLLQNRGDRIAFVPDETEWPFEEGSREELPHYRDVTGEVVEALIEEGILADEGIEQYGEDEPELYHRRLRNVWGS